MPASASSSFGLANSKYLSKSIALRYSLVHPCQLFDIEDGGRFAQPCHIKFLFQLLEGEDFHIIGGTPAKQCDIVHDGFTT